MRTTVTVFYNVNSRNFFGRHGDPVDGERFESVAEFKLFHDNEVDDNAVAEHVFRLMNRVDGREPVSKLEVRSMSVGDLLSIDGLDGNHQLICRSAGFEDVSGKVSTAQVTQKRVPHFPVIVTSSGALVY